MTTEHREEAKRFAEFISDLSPEEISEGNRAEFERAAAEFDRFQAAYTADQCYLCQKSLKTFSKNSPCIHWLLKPKGFKKKDVSAIAAKFGFQKITSYLRWCANQEVFARGINDLALEGTGKKIIELTIKWKNIEWAFSCSESDYAGHASSRHAQHPHYHLQMRIDSRPFINYNDFHLPLDKMDIVMIEAQKINPNIVQNHSFGEGIAEFFNPDTLDLVLETPTQDVDESEAAFSIDSLIVADEGKTIKGEDFYNLIQEAKEKGVSVASLTHKLPDTSTKVIVSPGDGVVEQAPRKGGRKRT